MKQMSCNVNALVIGIGLILLWAVCPAEGQLPGVSQPAQKQPELPAVQHRSLSNADVIRMVKGGVPESTVLTSIQSSPSKFDLSPDALVALHRAGVSQKVMDAMMAHAAVRRAAVPRKAVPAKARAVVKNPRAAQADVAIVAVLQKQKQAAELEASQMVRTGVRPAALQGTPSKPMSATSGNRAQAPMPAPAQKVATAGTISPGKATASSGSPLASFGQAPELLNSALPCVHDATMTIVKVSGDFYPATFTPDKNYNFYTITGCSFGDQGSNSKVYIYYKDTFHQDFIIQEWHENGIKLNLNPSLTGLLDQDNLTLVVQRNDGKQATKNGFKFYAARDTTPLSHIPQSAFSLNRFTPTDTSHLQLDYSSPSSPATYPYLNGYTAAVGWLCTNCSAKTGSNFGVYAQPGEDVYQFKNLQPGFVPENAGLDSADIDCGGRPVHKEGNFDLKWVADDLHVQWQGQTCMDQGCGGALPQPDCFDSNGTAYGVNVWVTGPRGVDPWTGQPATH